MEPLDGAVLVVTANHFTIADLLTQAVGWLIGINRHVHDGNCVCVGNIQRGRNQRRLGLLLLNNGHSSGFLLLLFLLLPPRSLSGTTCRQPPSSQTR